MKNIKKNTKKSNSLTENFKIIVDLDEYRPWSGATYYWDKIVDADKLEDFDAYLEELYPEGLTKTDLNDILWFEGSSVLKDLGIESDEEELEEMSDDFKEAMNLSKDLGEYQTWVDYDMEKYHRISDVTMGKLRKAGLTVVKDDHGDWEVIAKKEDDGHPLKESTLDSNTFLGTIKFNDKEYYVLGEKTHTRNYHYEHVRIEQRDNAIAGEGSYRWMNRPWQRFDYASALIQAVIAWDKTLDTTIRDIVEKSYSANEAVNKLNNYLNKDKAEVKEDLDNTNKYRGTKVELIWHGTQSDPELSIDNYVANYYDVEDTLWDEFKDLAKELKWTIDETKDVVVNEDGEETNLEDTFTDYVKKNEDKVVEYVKEFGSLIEGCSSKKKVIKEGLDNSPYKDIISDYFDSSMDFDFLDIVANSLEGIDFTKDDNSILTSVLDNLIYDDDLWAIIKFYQRPKECNYDEAMDSFSNDILALVSLIVNQNTEKVED